MTPVSQCCPPQLQVHQPSWCFENTPVIFHRLSLNMTADNLQSESSLNGVGEQGDSPGPPTYLSAHLGEMLSLHEALQVASSETQTSPAWLETAVTWFSNFLMPPVTAHQ